MRKIISPPEMNHPLHIQNFKISINKAILNQFLETDSLHLERKIEVIGAEIKVIPESIDWTIPKQRDLDLETVINISLQNRDWSFSSLSQLLVFVHWNPTPFQWINVNENHIPSIQLGENSEFRINNHEIQLTSTINAILLDKKEEWIHAVKKSIITKVTEISNQYFGSDFLVDILKSYFYQISLDSTSNDITGTLSISPDNVHTDQYIRDQSQIKIDLSEKEFLHLLDQIPFPVMSAMGYTLSIAKIEPTDHNKLTINLIDKIKNLKIDLNTEVNLSDNEIHLKILNLDIRGMNWLKSGVFRMLKTTIIRKIEKRSIPISSLYHSFIFDITKKYPFLQVQENQELYITNLEISPEGFSVLLDFSPLIAD